MRLLSRSLPAQAESYSRACQGLPGLCKATRISYTATVGGALARGGKSSLSHLRCSAMVHDNLCMLCSPMQCPEDYPRKTIQESCSVIMA